MVVANQAELGEGGAKRALFLQGGVGFWGKKRQIFVHDTVFLAGTGG